MSSRRPGNDTKQLLQDAPIIPDQFWCPKNFDRKVTTKSPKSYRKVTEMTLKWCLGDAWMVPEWSQNATKKSWKVMFSAKKVVRKSQSWRSIKIHEFSWVMIVHKNSWFSWVMIVHEKSMNFHAPRLFSKFHEVPWVMIVHKNPWLSMSHAFS